MYKFNSSCNALGKFAKNISNSVIKNEPMFYRASLSFAYDTGCEITKSFIDALPEDWKGDDVIFSSRVHMLMKDWFPAIPGFHHDDVPRSTFNGQPNYDNPEYYSEHILGLVNADICPTEFALGSCELDKVDTGENVYQGWHKGIERLLKDGSMQSFKTPDRTLLYFDWQSFHQATRATEAGWRWFGRVTRNSNGKIKNEIRRQVQVYLNDPFLGW